MIFSARAFFHRRLLTRLSLFFELRETFSWIAFWSVSIFFAWVTRACSLKTEAVDMRHFRFVDDDVDRSVDETLYHISHSASFLSLRKSWDDFLARQQKWMLRLTLKLSHTKLHRCLQINLRSSFLKIDIFVWMFDCLQIQNYHFLRRSISLLKICFSFEQCLAWAIQNHYQRQVSMRRSLRIVIVKAIAIKAIAIVFFVEQQRIFLDLIHRYVEHAVEQ